MPAADFIESLYKLSTTSLTYNFAVGYWDGVDQDINRRTGKAPDLPDAMLFSQSTVAPLPSIQFQDSFYPPIRDTVSAAFDAWSNISSNLRFTELPDDQQANINLYSATLRAVPDGQLFGVTERLPPEDLSYSLANIVFDPRLYELEKLSHPFSYSIQLETAIHEIGHALGLDHPGHQGGRTVGFTPDMTVMTYLDNVTDSTRQPISPMPYDIMAISQLYGLGDIRNGDGDSYDYKKDSDEPNTFNGTDRSWTIVDTGGQRNVIDLSGAPGDQKIDLRQAINAFGDWTYAPTIVNGLEYVYIAQGSVIQDAVGSNGNDIIYGNSSDNTLTGGPGNDFIDGGDGNDVAVFSGNRADYNITYNSAATLRNDSVGLRNDPAGSYIISEVGNGNKINPDGSTVISDGSDTLVNIEYLSFSDGVVPLQPENISTFGDGTDDWSLAVFFGGDSVSWQPAGGSPGGYLRWVNKDSVGPTPNNLDYWSAPRSFLAGMSGMYGGTLSYEIEDNRTNLTGFADVKLVGGQETLVHAVGQPGQGWTPFSVPLSEVGWKVGNLAGPNATAEQMHDVLDDVGVLEIRAEYAIGSQNGNPETGGLDNVSVEAPRNIGLSIAPLDAVKPEGNSGATPFTFVVTRSGDTSTTAEAQYTVTPAELSHAYNVDFYNASYSSDGEVTPATLDDFYNASFFPRGEVMFAAGDTSEIITVNVQGDLAPEPDEGFTVTLDYPANVDIISDTAGGIILNDDGAVACFAAGTLVTTQKGECPVESLAIGDMVVTHAGGYQPIKWIGRRSYAGRFLTRNPHVQPIRFRAGALGNNLPRRDLLVSPEHAMFLDGLLVPAGCLTNGSTIVQESKLWEVNYHHIELEGHDVLLAEGAPSESFLDDDSRGIFHNAAEYGALYPDASKPGRFYAPRVKDGYQLEAIRQRLATVAEKIALAA